MNKIQTGIDIGSRSIEIVVLENGDLIEKIQCDTGHDPIKQITEAYKNPEQFSGSVMVTGYGRHLLEVRYNFPTVTELKAYARGISARYPSIRTVLDIGGQDTKTIGLMPDGRIRKFEMNDRCAAGTGKFLELVSNALGYSMDEFCDAAMNTEAVHHINSMCAVFAESEVTSLITSGADRAAIARGLHYAVAKRTTSMLSRLNWQSPIAFAGGVALNKAMVSVLEDVLDSPVIIPENPQFTGAFGAAMLA